MKKNFLLFIIIAIHLWPNCLAQITQEAGCLYNVNDCLVNDEKIVVGHELWNQNDMVLVDTTVVSLQEWLISRGLTGEMVINPNLEKLYQNVLKDYSEDNDIIAKIDFHMLCDSLRAYYGSQHLCYAIAQEINALLNLNDILYSAKTDQILPLLIDAHRIYGTYGKIEHQRRVERLMLRSICINDYFNIVSRSILLQADSIFRRSFGNESREYLLCLNKIAKIANVESGELAELSQILYNRLFETYNHLGLPKDSLFVSSVIESVENWHSPYVNENVVRAVNELYDVSWLSDSVFGYVTKKYRYCTDSICKMQRIYIYSQGKRLMESRKHTKDSLYFYFVKELVNEYWSVCLNRCFSYDFWRLLDISNDFFEEFSLSDEPFFNKLGLSEKMMDIVCFRVKALDEVGNIDKATELAKDYLKITRDYYGVLSGSYYKRIKNVWLYANGLVEDFSLLSEKVEVERYFLGEKSETFQQTLRDLADHYVAENNYLVAIQLMENLKYKDAGTLYTLARYYDEYGDRKKAVESYYQLYDVTRKLKTPDDSLFLDAAVYFIGRYADKSEKKHE